VEGRGKGFSLNKRQKVGCPASESPRSPSLLLALTVRRTLDDPPTDPVEVAGSLKVLLGEARERGRVKGARETDARGSGKEF